MSTAPASESDVIDETRREFPKLVGEIVGFIRSAGSLADFYEGLLQRVVAAIGAAGGAIWTIDEAGRLGLACEMKPADSPEMVSDDDRQLHERLLRRVLASGQAAAIPPRFSGNEGEGNPSNYLLVIGLLRSDQEVRGVVEIFQRGEVRPSVVRGCLQFVAQMCDLAGDFLKTHQLRQFVDREAMWGQLEQFTLQVHRSLDPRVTAYTIANEGRRLIDCDRVSVAIGTGRHCNIEAVSGQATADKRSNTIKLMSQLAAAVVASGEPLWYTGDAQNLPPQVERAVEAYVDESYSKLLAVIPLAKPTKEVDQHAKAHDCQEPPELVGALIVEQFATTSIAPALRPRVAVVVEHSSHALSNALQHDNLFLMPLWRTLGNARWIVRARTLPKTMLALGLLAFVLLSLFLIPADFQLHGRGTLEPVAKRDVFAGVDGVVSKVFVDHGDEIHVGDKLVELTNTDLNVSMAEVAGRITANQAQIQSVTRALLTKKVSPEERNQLAGQLLQLKTTQASLEGQLTLFREKKQKLVVRSPINGRVITWQAREKLVNRPVEKGELLMTVADPTKVWELEVHLPEDRMGHIARAQKERGKNLKVTYVLATDPSQEHVGEVSEVQAAAEVQGEDGNVVLVRVAIDEHDLGGNLRPGAGVSAKFDCGRRSLGYVWFHDVIAFVQKFLFRL